MGTELNVFYQMLDREIENIIYRVAPQLSSFSGTAKQKVHGYIEPYVQALLGSDGKVDTNTAAEFAKEEACSKIEAFKEKLKNKEAI